MDANGEEDTELPVEILRALLVYRFQNLEHGLLTGRSTAAAR